MAKPKIYTKGGDLGETSLVSGARVAKTHPRLLAYGAIDELNSQLGVCATAMNADALTSLRDEILQIQHSLFNMGSQLSCDDEKLSEKLPDIADEDIQKLESSIDRMSDEMPELKNFILPGGSAPAAQMHVARTVCRRCERELLNLADSTDVASLHIVYLNRLSDYLFTAARYCNHCLKHDEILWQN